MEINAEWMGREMGRERDWFSSTACLLWSVLGLSLGDSIQVPQMHDRKPVPLPSLQPFRACIGRKLEPGTKAKTPQMLQQECRGASWCSHHPAKHLCLLWLSCLVTRSWAFPPARSGSDSLGSQHGLFPPAWCPSISCARPGATLMRTWLLFLNTSWFALRAAALGFLF